MLRFLTAGESHGPGLVTIVEGLPAGLPVASSVIGHELARRRLGFGRGKRMQVEADELEILGGVRHGRTIGAPVAVLVRNSEWPKWQEIMSPDPGGSGKPVTRPRPGHADLTGMLKYDTGDARDVLERASARETAARTVAGVLARSLLSEIGVAVVSHVTAIGSVSYDGPAPGPDDQEATDASEVRCIDEAGSRGMAEAITRAMEDKDTLGGVFEVLAYGAPPGLGSYVQFDRRLDGLLAAAFMSIPAIKGVEIGAGFRSAAASGLEAHDEIRLEEGTLVRATNRAGGIEGGMSNGETITVRAAMKPISTLMSPLQTVDMTTGEPAQAVRERSDVCAVPAAAVVGEQMICWVLASESVRKYGGDTVGDYLASHRGYMSRVQERSNP